MRYLTTLCLLLLTMPAIAAETVHLDKLTKGETLHGFRAAAVYLSDTGRPMGARFIHRKSGFLDAVGSVVISSRRNPGGV